MASTKLTLEKIGSEVADQEVGLKPFTIFTYPADFTLEVLVKKWKAGEIKKPEYQRNYVWNQGRASKLIESFLLGLPVPPVYLYQERDTSKLLVVDGHQRLRSIVYFFDGWFGDRHDENSDENVRGKAVPFVLTGLDEQSPFLGSTYQGLIETDEDAKNRLETAVLRSFVMKQVDPEDDTSVYEVFSRLNTGGMILHPQEIRNCVLEGTLNDLLKELNKLDDWRQIIGTTVVDKRMRDVELILRFFALYENVAKYEKPMKDFLNKFMKRYRYDTGAKKSAKKKPGKNPGRAVTTDYRTLFENTSEIVLRALGPKPFHIKKGLNAAVFDSVFTAFAQHFKGKRVDLGPLELRRLKTKFGQLLRKRDYLDTITSATTDKDVVGERIRLAKAALFN